MRYALVGNQNCGKTTLFNQLTGSNQHVGNFPGVTVDSKIGEIRGEKGDCVVDLPGIYSIRPYTNEELVTRRFILKEHPDGIINIVAVTLSTGWGAASTRCLSSVSCVCGSLGLPWLFSWLP